MGILVSVCWLLATTRAAAKKSTKVSNVVDSFQSFFLLDNEALVIV